MNIAQRRARARERRLLIAAHPLIWLLGTAAARIGSVVSLPRIGHFVSDPALLRELLGDAARFGGKARAGGLDEAVGGLGDHGQAPREPAVGGQAEQPPIGEWQDHAAVEHRHREFQMGMDRVVIGLQRVHIRPEGETGDDIDRIAFRVGIEIDRGPAAAAHAQRSRSLSATRRRDGK